MIDYQLLGRDALRAYISDPAYLEQPHLPISRHRAQSQLLNPRMSAEDTLLILAREGEELLGYLGVLPDWAYFDGATAEKCGWLSCIWVNPAARGKGIGGKLTRQALDAWGGRVFAANYVPAIRPMYDRSGAFLPAPHVQIGLRLYLQADFATLLPPKRPVFERAQPLLRLGDRLLNVGLEGRLKLIKASLENWSLEYVDGADQEAGDFIAARQERQLFRRGAAEWNWMLRHPWVLSAPAPDPYSRKYYFSSLDRHFSFHALKLRDERHRLRAFLIFSRRNDWLKLPCCYADCPPERLAELIRYLLLAWRIKGFTTYQPELAAALRRDKRPAFYQKEIRQYALVGKAMGWDPAEQAYGWQDGEGDAAFT